MHASFGVFSPARFLSGAPSKSERTTSAGLVYKSPVSAPPRPRMSIDCPSGLRPLTWPVVSLKRPSFARIRQESATVFAKAASALRFLILNFGPVIPHRHLQPLPNPLLTKEREG